MGYTFTVDPDEHADDHNILRREGAVTTVWRLSDDDILALDNAVSARASAIRQARWNAMDPPRPGPAPTEEREWVVRWEFMTTATHARSAALKARAAQIRPIPPGTIAAFEVYGPLDQHGNPPQGPHVTIDLAAGPGPDAVCGCRCREGRHCGGCGHAGCGYLPE